MVRLALRCCAKTIKGTRCKLSNSFTGEFCHIHCPKVAEPVTEPVAEPVAEPEPEKEVKNSSLRINVFPEMDSKLWQIVLDSVEAGPKFFKDSLDWVACDEFGASDQKVEFWFDKSFPRVGNAMKYDGKEGMEVSFHKPTKQLMVKIDFTQ
jgi:hypothetical protein